MTIRTFFAALVVFAALSVVLFNAGNSALDGMCGNDILQTVRSPDGTMKAVVFERGCGAATGYSQQLSVIAAGDTLPNRAGNVFVADGGHGAAPNGPQVSVRWQNRDRLRIRHHPKARVFSRQSRVPVKTGWFSGRDVSIAYNQ